MNLIKASWKLLSSKQKKYAFFIFFLMFVGMILESLSVGIIIPLISVILKGNFDTSFFSSFFVFGNLIIENLLYVGLLVTFIIFVIKNLVLVFNLWQQTNFLRQLQFETTNRLFKHYLGNDYIFFIENNSGHLYRNLTDVVGNFVSYIRAHIILLSEAIVFLGVTSILFYLDFVGTLIILFLTITLALLIYFSTIKKISFFGKERNKAGGELNKHLLQGMASAKDVKILDREDDLIHQVKKNNFLFTKANQIAQFFAGLPKFFFEILIVFAFSIITFLMVFTGKNMSDIIQYLTVFAVGSFRIVPGVTKFLTSYQLIKYIEPSIKILIKEFSSDGRKIVQLKNSDKIIKFNQEINLNNINFSYPLRKEFSLSNITMEIKKGDFIGIVGETGSGKSTLVNLIIGLFKPSSGKIEVDKIDIHSNVEQWYKKIGYVPQSIFLIDDSIRKNIAFGLLEEDINDELVNLAIKKANLNNFLNSLPEGLNTIVGEKGIRLSGGQQQRIGIARALYRNPEILILDESTSSLDQDTEKKIMESVQSLKKEKTLIVITHRLVTVKNCDKIFYIEKGQLTQQGSPKEILSNI